MRIATWNVNSIGARLPRLLPWLEEVQPDVVALQETKCADSTFPFADLKALGYEAAHSGDGRWNGVAIASRIGLSDPHHELLGHPEPRLVSAQCGPLHVHSLYVPNGRALGDPHYDYKLAWLTALRNAAGGWLAADPAAQVALVGDWNIAPQDDDVWDMSVFAHSTHVTGPERAAFRAVVDAGYADVVRPLAPGPGVYTYWDYTQLRFPRREGMRIDFVLGTPALAGRVTGALIDREERKGKGASDHAPVVVELA